MTSSHIYHMNTTQILITFTNTPPIYTQSPFSHVFAQWGKLNLLFTKVCYFHWFFAYSQSNAHTIYMVSWKWVSPCLKPGSAIGPKPPSHIHVAYTSSYKEYSNNGQHTDPNLRSTPRTYYSINPLTHRNVVP